MPHIMMSPARTGWLPHTWYRRLVGRLQPPYPRLAMPVVLPPVKGRRRESKPYLKPYLKHGYGQGSYFSFMITRNLPHTF